MYGLYRGLQFLGSDPECLDTFIKGTKLRDSCWVAVKEVKLNYQNTGRYIYIFIYDFWLFDLSSLATTQADFILVTSLELREELVIQRQPTGPLAQADRNDLREEQLGPVEEPLVGGGGEGSDQTYDIVVNGNQHHVEVCLTFVIDTVALWGAL